MHLSLLAALVAAALYAGFQWTVQVVVYPQMTPVSPGAATDFPAYEAAHQRRIIVLVGPLFAGLVGSAGWLLIDRGPVPWTAVLVACALVATVVGATGLLAVPAHRALSSGWDVAAHRRLMRADRIRVAAATAHLLVLVGVAVAI